jgi:hypothetical protein
MYEGFTDIFVQTYRGTKMEGAIGATKALGKVLVSLSMKTTAGVVGLVAYPAQGIAKSLRAAVKSSVKERIAEAKVLEGEWLAKSEAGLRVDHTL